MSSDSSDRSPDEQRVVPPADGQRVDHAQKSRRWVRMIKVSVRLLVLGLVGWGIWRTIEQAGEGLQNRDFSVRQVDVTWMALAGLFYVFGLVPCWVFWHRTLVAMGQQPRWRESLRAFWIGHLGKYVPGKAMVVVLRTGLVYSDRVNKTVAATSVFVETLTMMAVGAFLSSVVLLFYSEHLSLTLLAVGLMICAGVPTLPPIFRRLVRMLRVERANPQIQQAIAGVDYRLMTTGWISISIGWLLLGLSLWATLRSLPGLETSLGQFPLLTATVGLAMVAGFLSLIPGGLGVRDWILMELLAPQYGAKVALVSAILLRLVWLLSELLISAILYVDVWRVRRVAPGTPAQDGPGCSDASGAAAANQDIPSFPVGSAGGLDKPQPLDPHSALDMPDKISIVIPVYNEQGSLEKLHDELNEVAQEQQYDLEILFVDDGSSDDSWEVIERLSKSDERVRGIRFRRNFGKAAALSAGFDAASAPIVFTMDADLQDDPHEIPRFLSEMRTGWDVISGWKKVRHDPWHKVGPSRVFNWLVGAMTGVRLHDHNCGFKCYRREVVQEVHLYGEMHRFVPVLAASRGWRVGEVVVHHRPREFGRSKYGVTRIIKGFLDLLTVSFLTDYGQRPQHLLGSIGLLCFSLGVFGITCLSGWWVISRLVETIPVEHLHKRALFYYSIVAVLLGAQFMAIGFLAELITARLGKDHRQYSIRQRVGADAAEARD